VKNQALNSAPEQRSVLVSRKATILIFKNHDNDPGLSKLARIEEGIDRNVGSNTMAQAATAHSACTGTRLLLGDIPKPIICR